MDRRNFLGGASALAGAVATSRALPTFAKTTTVPSGSPVATPQGNSSTLLVYFSRAGENYYYGDRIDLEIGNTQVVAEMIASSIAVEVYRIEAAEAYPDDYEETVARNVDEQNADARPAIANPPPSIADYDTVLLGSGIWNVRPPMIMSTFVESLDFSGKTIFPFVTYAVSGLGSTMRVYADLCPDSTIGEGLAVRGEEASEARPDVENWLRGIGLLQD